MLTSKYLVIINYCYLVGRVELVQLVLMVMDDSSLSEVEHVLLVVWPSLEPDDNSSHIGFELCETIRVIPHKPANQIKPVIIQHHQPTTMGLIWLFINQYVLYNSTLIP